MNLVNGGRSFLMSWFSSNASLYNFSRKNMSISYHPCTSPSSNKPLVILLPWLRAKPKHVSNYLKLYHHKGYDVLTTQIQISHFLWPALCNKALDRFIEELSFPKHVSRPLIFHSFSVGSFFLSNFHLKLLNEPDHCGELSNRILGYVSDSITIGSPREMIEGIMRAMSLAPGLRTSLVRSVLTSYLSLTKPWTVSVYEKLTEAWHNYLPASVPMLYFYSLDDPMSDPEAMDRLIAYQKSIGRKTMAMHWEKSTHAMHYIKHQEDYIQALNSFLHKVDPENNQITNSKL